MSETYTVKDQRRRGWYWINNELLDRYADQIGPLGIAVYNALARRADSNGRCWPSHADIMRLTAIKSRTTVIECLKQLEEVGLIEIQHVEGRPNTYILKDITYEPVQQMDTRCSGDEQGCPAGGQGGVQEMNRGVQEMNRGCSADEHEGRPNKDYPIRTTHRRTTTTSNQCSANGHPESRTIRTNRSSSSSLTWQKLIDQYGVEAVEEAKEAAPPNKRRSVKYVAGILRNWQREGGLSYAPHADDQPDDSSPMSDADRQRLNELFAALGINRQV